MRVKSKKITFKPLSKLAEGVVPRPEPAGKSIPDWWKTIPAFRNGGKPIFNVHDMGPDTSVKLCVPFADTFKMGYIQTTWTDIYIEPHEFDEYAFNFYVASEPEIFKMRPQSQIQEFQQVKSTYYAAELEWRTQWAPKLPKGYSALLTHPLNREDLPFTTLSGIIDADKWHHDGEGNHPFFIKKGFSGIIPAGTPMYQIIPFKRDDWVSEVEEYSEQTVYDGLQAHNVFWGAYKNRFWTKKNFK